MKKDDPKPNKPRLGRGLGTFFASDDDETSPEESGVDSQDVATPSKDMMSSSGQRLVLPIASIYPNKDQPRRRFSESALQELAQSIADQQVLQPILVRVLPDQSYQIIAGERRWRAAQLAGLHEIPVIVREIEDEDVLKVSLIENIQRSNLSPVEEARAFDALIKQHDHTQETVARVVGKSRSHVANSLRLLSLSDVVLHTIEEDNISAGHARALVGLEERQALDLIEEIKAKDLTVRIVEQKTQGIKKERFPEIDETHAQKVKDIESTLSEALGYRVMLQLNAKQRGSIKLYFRNSLELNELIKKLATQIV